jgi:hypothetical protein
MKMNNFSLAEIRAEASQATVYKNYLIIEPSDAYVQGATFDRLVQVGNDTNAAIVYGDYEILQPDGTRRAVQTIPYQEGSVRDDFDFGPIMLLNSRMVEQALAELTDCNYKYAGLYAVRLKLSTYGSVVHVPEVVATVDPTREAERTKPAGEEQFNYVDPRNREAQIEMERAFTAHLKDINAYLPASQLLDVQFDEIFAKEASVIIPVRNRVNTIADAINSALNQDAKFPYNILVVDNFSTDGTTDVIDKLAKQDARVIRITPPQGCGIGGCWNAALNSLAIGRFAIQLDSDDVYADETVLSTIVRTFYETRAAMVIGSYTLTDFDLNVIPPGLIDHAEWTDENGHNNALRINGLGAPRAFYTPAIVWKQFPNTCYGEDYAAALRVSREFRIARIFKSLYNCRRWSGNSDSNLPIEKINANNQYKDWIRTVEIQARKSICKR